MPSFARAAANAAMIGCALALASCSTVTRQEASSAVVFAQARDAFEVSGRMSLRHGSEALAASFRWHHEANRDVLDLASPTGQTVARLRGAPGVATLETSDGHVETAADWTGLAVRSGGWALPVDGLAFWIQGLPRSGAPFTVEPGTGTNPGVLRQDGWTIVYLAFAPDAEGAPRPARLSLSYPDVDLRLAIDAWQ